VLTPVFPFAKDIAHRDLKLENVLLSQTVEGAGAFNIKLTDFGLCAQKQKNELLSASCGTPLYMGTLPRFESVQTARQVPPSHLPLPLEYILPIYIYTYIYICAYIYIYIYICIPSISYNK